MRSFPAGALWHASYAAIVRSTFATVPLYREAWALHGRTGPVVAPGRTGVGHGAITRDVAVRKMVDLVPLAGGDAAVDPLRGLRPVLTLVHKPKAATFVVVLKGRSMGPAADLRLPVHGCVIDPEGLAGVDANGVPAEVVHAWQRKDRVVAVGDETHLHRLFEVLPANVAHLVDELHERTLHDLDAGPGVIYDPLMGYLGGLRGCGHWHLDWPRVYARQAGGGLAFTLLRQRSPRLVDIVLADGAVEQCPRHGAPVLVT